MDKVDTSLDKGLVLLRMIAEDNGATAFREMADRLNMPLSTAHRILATLKDHGLVCRLGAGRYGAGIELASLAGLPNRLALIARVARPFLDATARETGLTLHLGALEDGMVTYAVKAEGAPADTAAEFTREGMQLEAYCSAVGRVLLAGLNKSEQRSYLSDGPFVQLTTRTVTSPHRLQGILELVSERGFAEDDREISDDLWCLAVPLRSKKGEVLCSVSASMTWHPKAALRKEDVIRSLQSVVGRIGDRL
ncbi:MAG: IclR family transcriptional regulator [Rhodobiaceae bacterium]|nr:IclR family transcriptional regulator [Rhodobiaceae bacterium]